MSISDGKVIGTTRIVDNGPASRRWNLVILGDGYQESQLGGFANDVQSFVDTLFATAPFDALKRAINVYRVDVSSVDSGADDPATCGGEDTVARTYFDASFCNNGIRRLLMVNNATVIGVASEQVPEWSMLMVIVNSTIHGGSGGQVACFSLAPGTNEIALHEMGHTAFGLADEYEYYVGCGAETDRDHHPAAEPAEPNVTIDMNRDTIKWRELIASTTAVPTMKNPDCKNCDGCTSEVPAETVGAFEGAHYHHCGAFRGQYTCRMRSLGNPFCVVCQRAIQSSLAPFLEQEPQEPLPLDDRRVFDVDFYLRLYPELCASIGKSPAAARDHWLKHGISEGRRGSRELDVQFYLGCHDDLKQTFGSDYAKAIDHWLRQGLISEGRRGSREFDVQFYLGCHDDLKQTFGTDYAKAVDHWIDQGLPIEGRRASREFDVQFYLAMHPDLQAIFGADYTAAFDHWVKTGLDQGRQGAPSQQQSV